ncbi:MAG: DUF1801 domain-containing protein [Anaerolineae bacterium]|jgi:hypothetical protein|nr:DUF1801 domain-containing protein [Anaerolineae bacterium]
MEKLFPDADPRILRVVAALRDLVLSVFPGAVESTDAKNLGFGFSTRYRDTVFVIAPHRDHVTLGFAYGAELPDPAGLLEGTGQRHRHIKVRSEESAHASQLRELLSSALTAARERRTRVV